MVYLASIQRVIQVLQLDDTPELEILIEPILESVDVWIRRICNGNWDAEGTTTDSFFDVDQDAILSLSTESLDPNTISIQTYLESPNEFVSDLFDAASDFEYLGRGKIRLTRSIYVAIPAFPGAWAQRFIRHYKKVLVTYTALGNVPPPVREAVALIAAATYDQQGTDTSNIKEETIGKYHYAVYELTRNANVGIIIPERARRLLMPFSRSLTARAI